MDTNPSFFEKNRLLIKGLLIGFLIVLMLIPAGLIGGLVKEREARQQQVVNEVSSKWADAQTVTGPILVVPYNYTYKGDGGKLYTVKKMVHFLPDVLRINGEIMPEVRKRSLYQVTLYRSQLKLEGSFPVLPFDAMGVVPESVLWGEARLLLGINDARGLEEEVGLQWNGSNQKLEAGMQENNTIKNGLSIPVKVETGSGGTFSIELKLRGSENLYFTPVGKTTEVSVHSTWQHPSFDGKYLPDTTASVNTKGFNAHWKILGMSRPYPQV